VHGQLRDLLLLFGWYGLPTHKGGDVQTTTYVFNGDWVDRGEHQLEVVLILFAIKVLYPTRVFIVRGNHEFRQQNELMEEAGFQHHVKRRFPKDWALVYEAVHDCFDWLPIGCVVGEAILCVHGGVGDGTWGLKELENDVPRPLADPYRTLHTLHALWSDPSDSDSAMRKGTHASARGETIPEFGPDITDKFCRANNLALVVRSHQFVRQGYKVMHSGRLITLFSARNYFSSSDGQTNDGAMLLIAPDHNGHLRIHPKRLAHLEPSAVQRVPAWRKALVSAFAKCMQVPQFV